MVTTSLKPGDLVSIYWHLQQWQVFGAPNKARKYLGTFILLKHKASNDDHIFFNLLTHEKLYIYLKEFSGEIVPL